MNFERLKCVLIKTYFTSNKDHVTKHLDIQLFASFYFILLAAESFKSYSAYVKIIFCNNLKPISNEVHHSNQSST